jgi:two-component system, NtrC family, response regulator GlrR
MKTQDKRMVLIVDDEPDLLDILEFDLVEAGYEVLRAQSGNEAFDIFTKNPIDVVLTDIRMDNGNGLDLLKNIKNHKPGHSVVILISGHSDLTDAAAKKLGAAKLFPKPYNINAVIETINHELQHLNS